MSEQATLTKLVAQHAGPLRLYACQLLDDGSADDVVQDAMIALFTLATPPDKPLPWMYRVIRNAAMDHRRSSQRRRRREERVAESRREWFTDGADNVIEADAAQSALSHLAAEDREIVVLRIWSGLPFSEIGNVLSRSASTVHTRYEAALTQMRSAMEKPCETKMIRTR